MKRSATACAWFSNFLLNAWGWGRLSIKRCRFPDISEQIAAHLDSPLARRDLRLRLRGLTVKGDMNLEWDVLGAERAWHEVRRLARELGDKAWENRANGELGIIAFLKREHPGGHRPRSVQIPARWPEAKLKSRARRESSRSLTLRPRPGCCRRLGLEFESAIASNVTPEVGTARAGSGMTLCQAPNFSMEAWREPASVSLLA